MSEVKARKVLSDLVKRSGCTYTTDNILTIFRNTDGKSSKKKQDTLLSQLFKTIPNGSKYVTQYTAAQSKDSYATLIVLLNTFVSDSSNAVPETVPHTAMDSVQKRSSLFESPPLSSTRIISEPVTPEDVQEIREKIAQAAIGSVSNRQSVHSVPTLMAQQQRPSAGFNFAHAKSPIAVWLFNYDELYPMQSKNIVAIPHSAQTSMVVKQLLCCLVGARGSLIVPKQTPKESARPVEFVISSQVTESLREVIEEILPLAANYTVVQEFIREAGARDSGQVLQALRATLKIIIRDYYESITHLTTLNAGNGLSPHKLLYFLRPVFRTMQLLADVLIEIRQRNCRGGQVLTLLYEQITMDTGNENCKGLLHHLIETAAEPYMNMLHVWIYFGIIKDPQQEFLVEHSAMDLAENELVDYWERQYTIRCDSVPCFLAKYADTILRTGKYLNVIRECSNIREFQRSTGSIIPLRYVHTEPTYVEVIENEFHFASSSLLNLIMDKYDLMGRLYSVKRYFLMQQGDFISEFMDAVEADLNNDLGNVLPIRLDSLLEVTLSLSCAKYDKYHDDLKTMLLPYGIVEQISKIVNNEEAFLEAPGDTSQLKGLKGIECFTFNYHAQWPVSIVLNLWTISKYQMIFRQLFYLKYVERMLCRVWIANNKARLFAPSTAKLYRTAFTLRQEMMIAIQSLESYMMIEVIEPNWHIFIQNIKQVKNIDEVLNYHQDFLDQCLKSCMLTDPDLVKAIITLCNTCIDFCEFLAEAQRHFVDAELTSMMASGDDFSLSSESECNYAWQQSTTTMAPTETFSEKVEFFRTEFTNQLVMLLKKISDMATHNPTEKFLNLLNRINFNSYYDATQERETRAAKRNN